MSLRLVAAAGAPDEAPFEVRRRTVLEVAKSC